VDEYYDKKTLTFLSHLIGSRGRQPALPAQGAGWVNQLAAGGGISGANFEDFGVSFGLTPLGDMWTDHRRPVRYLKLIERGGRPGAMRRSAACWNPPSLPGAGPGTRHRLRPRAQPVQLRARRSAHGDYMMREFDEPLIGASSPS
jgi:hypothetical protein